MAIQTTRTLAQLERECKEKGLNVTPAGKKMQKQDYVLALREYYLSCMPKVPKALELMLKIESPALCRQMKTLKEHEQAEVWEGKDWVFEEKLDGARILPIFIQGDGMDYYSRNNSVEDFLPISYKDNIVFDSPNDQIIDEDFILDCECISTNPKVQTDLAQEVTKKTGVLTETQLTAVTALLSLNSAESQEVQRRLNYPLKLVVFDTLYVNGEWLLDQPLYKRRQHTRRLVAKLEKAGYQVELVQSCYTNRREFYRLIVASGGEGVIAKNVYSPYIASSNRSREGWIKIKRSMSETALMEGFGDTIDGFITGFELADEDKSWAGLVGSLDISVFLEDDEGNTRPHVVARVASIPLDLRQEMTEVVDGAPTLKKEWYGKVVSIDGQAVSARAKRFRHAVISQFRPDRSADTCILKESFLNRMIL